MPIWNYIVIGLSAVLLAFLLWKEVNRSLRERLLWRIIANILAIVALASMAIDIHYQVSNNSSTKKPSILLTNGYEEDSVASFIKAHSSVDTITLINAATASNLHVFGNGFNVADLQHLYNQSINFHPSLVPNGTTAIHWQPTIHSGDKLIIQGIYNNTSKKAVTICLNAFGNNVDTVTIKPQQIQAFHLQTIPKHSGRSVYSVIVMANKDTLENNALPFEIIPTQPLRVLVLAASPNFENKFLKNWLYENNYAVAAKTTVSKDKYETNFSNTKASNLDNITTSLLSNFDVLVADDEVLKALSSNELNSLKSEIVQHGLGLVITRDSANSNTKFYEQPFAITTTSGNEKKTLSLQYANTSEKLTIEQPSFLKPSGNKQVLITDDSARILAAASILGMGKLVATTLNNTYSLVLQNRLEGYYQLWSLLLQKATKQTAGETVASISPSIIYQYQQANIVLETNTEPLGSTFNNSALAFRPYVQLPYQWSASCWSKQTGWQQLQTATGFSKYFYVFKPTDWVHVAATNDTHATQLYAANHSAKTNNIATITSTLTVEFPKIYCFILFLLAIGSLWLERKL